MDQLDELLTQSRPCVTPSASLGMVVDRITQRPRRRGVFIAGLVTLSLAGATTAAATTGPLGDLIDMYLGGERNDHAWETDITGTDGTQHCVGGIVVMPARSKPGYTESSYLAIKQFVQEHDWSDLQPDRSLLRSGQVGTAEQLAITADRTMIVIAQEAGYSVDSITTRGTAECSPK